MAIACFKIESHNHPSAVEPFQGAATGVGGILRDIFMMGPSDRPAQRPALRPGGPDQCRADRRGCGRDRPLRQLRRVPTVGGEVAFDPSYSGNPLVNAMALGLMETDEIVKSGAIGVGNRGLHGQHHRSRWHGWCQLRQCRLSADSLDDRPAVQVGDPFVKD